MRNRIRVKRGGTSSPSVRVKVLKTTVTRADTSRQIHTDHSIQISGGLIPLQPPYDIHSLVMLKERSNILRQCIKAMVTNVGMAGWDIVKAHPDVEMDPEEVEELQSFIDAPNSEESLTSLHAKLVDDSESLGFGFFEFIRDRSSRVSVLRHVRASTTLLCPRDPELVKVTYDVARGPRVSNVTEYRTFRRYRQEVGGKYVFFKEFGDPRRMHMETGAFEVPGGELIPESMLATELAYIPLNTDSDTMYGLPNWINQLPSILGSRESEEVNLRYFEDNTVPPMIISVTGGRITAESYRDLRGLLNGDGLGKDRQNQVLLLEAVPEKDSLDEKGGTVQFKVDKLSDARQSDSLFSAYDEANQAKIRSSFRLPPVAIGLSQDVTFATANVSMYVAESQVYSPERRRYDEVYNKTLVQSKFGLNLKTVALRSRNPSITSPDTVIKSLTALNVMGAITPRKALLAATQVLDLDISPYPEKDEKDYEEWMDQPIALTLKATGGASNNSGETPDNTHDEQGQKDDKVKETEEDGDVSMKGPEHGQE